MNAAGSIRLRLFALAVAGIVVALALAGLGLSALFTRHLERGLAQELDAVIGDIAGNLTNQPGGGLTMRKTPPDPRFADIFSGLYWQVSTDGGKPVMRSPSLWDSELKLPADTLVQGETHQHAITGPDGAELMLREAVYRIESGEGPAHTVRISVAMDRAGARELTAGFNRDLMPALVLLALVLLAGAWAQVRAGLKPLDAVRAGVQDIREGRSHRLGTTVPREVSPLVEEMNALLERQETDMRRARDRAADLAHGLKTPLTALAADVEALRTAGQGKIAGSVEDVAQRMRRTVERELARSRLRNRPGTARPVAVLPAVSSILRIVSRTPQGERIGFHLEGDRTVSAAIETDDLNDILGNLLENAARHARSSVTVSVRREGADVVLEIADDGTGVDDDRLERLARRGMRDDERGGSAGLGLAIVSDILSAYGRRPVFATGREGGLSVTVRLPAPGSAGSVSPPLP
ncbi:histidine kinase [Zhengella mangrovi]|uniref:histidine kinase n=1 Tax=Zhengella mangrovi TaxID=1982044 RepID=A0A2G1QH63_9HYPH|nr:HAMP domain-containing sensor histidine kinase [Zhengella mangrovi]PHP64809.1 histidine kinase [Zhengella mangrovi]